MHWNISWEKSWTGPTGLMVVVVVELLLLQYPEGYWRCTIAKKKTPLFVSFVWHRIYEYWENKFTNERLLNKFKQMCCVGAFFFGEHFNIERDKGLPGKKKYFIQSQSYCPSQSVKCFMGQIKKFKFHKRETVFRMV